MNRRGFLSGILAMGAAPAIVKAESLMKIIVPPEKKIILGRGNTKTLTFYDEAAFLQHPQRPSYYMDFEGDAIVFTEQFAAGIEARIVYCYVALDQRPKTVYPEKTDFSKAKLLRLGNG